MYYPRFNLPEKLTCPGSTALCREHCYACKASRCYPQVMPFRMSNFEASKQPNFVQSIIDELKAHNKPVTFFRIHESGDFYSQEYLDKWIEIALFFPAIKFLAFTKSFSLDFSRCPSNLRIVWSVFPDTNLSTVPAGPRAYAGSIGDTTMLDCHGSCDTCGLCWNLREIGRNVHFDLH